MFVSCEDELLTGTPSWLGSSIYEELERRGNYQTTLKLINDPVIQQQTVLSLTGSKTLFVANDEAYDRFFKNNSWGVRNFEGLSDSQKRLLFNSSMVNSAYLMELMPNLSNGSQNPTEGACMRRTTALSLFDSIPALKAADMPDNSYWAYYRSKYPNAGTDGMLVLRDNTPAPMVHFLPTFMTTNAITDGDLAFLTNGACNSTAESYINGQRLLEQDITCQNGYIQVLENVMDPLTNMAEVIRRDTALSTFSGLLDRFCVPLYDESVTNSYNAYNTSGQVDSVFVWRYLNSGFESPTGGYDALSTFDGETKTDLLPYDPGWNQYQNGAGGMAMESDMGCIIAPTNKAFEEFFKSNSSGQLLLQRYGEIDEIPDHIVLDMLENYMKYSLVATVPSKFGTVVNSVQENMGLSEASIDSCLMANNGVVYKANKVFDIPEYSSVTFPASLDDDLRIMRTMIEDLNYDAYLNSMQSAYILVLPTDEALKNYVDPVDYCKGRGRQTITEFYYDDAPYLIGNRIKCIRWNATEDTDGHLVKRDTEVEDPWENYGAVSVFDAERDYVRNRMKDILDNSIIVKDDAASQATGKSVWRTRSGCPLILQKGQGDNMEFVSPFEYEIGGENAVTIPLRKGDKQSYYQMNNGETFIVDNAPIMPATKSVPDLLNELRREDDRYTEFYNILTRSTTDEYTLVNNLYDAKGTAYKSVSNGQTINLMSNYNYTIYVPQTEDIERLYELDLLPDYRDVNRLERQLQSGSLSPDEREEIAAQVDSMNTLINNFVRYHIQNQSIFLDAPAEDLDGGVTYETAYLKDNGRFSTLRVTNTGTDITICCTDLESQGVEEKRTVETKAGYHFAREYRFRTGMSTLDTDQDLNNDPTLSNINTATRIYNSSSAVIYLIDEPLLYSAEAFEKYSNAASQQP